MPEQDDGVPGLAEVDAAEAEYTVERRPALGSAFVLLVKRWEAGRRDDETCLRLLFLAWYACAEPAFLTGLTEHGTAALFRAIDAHFGGVDSTHAEFLCVAGYMASTFAFCIGGEDEWRARGVGYLRRARSLRPEGFAPHHFQGRGAYGQYFAHIAESGGFERISASST